VGVALQANLRRTADDVARLADVPGEIRLVKGAYDPPAELAYEGKDRIDRAYEALLEQAFGEYDGGIAVATHDQGMIDRALELHREYGTDFELQMLMGVRESAQFELAADYDVWQYVPYGSKWLSYFYRRVAERKENLLFVARAVWGNLSPFS
jgi:proline dehydrogenase